VLFNYRSFVPNVSKTTRLRNIIKRAVNRVWSPEVLREGNDNLLCNGMLVITLQARMRRHVTVNFIIGYISVKSANKGDETVSKSHRNIILVRSE
jgi:hypothetical protein